MREIIISPAGGQRPSGVPAIDLLRALGESETAQRLAQLHAALDERSLRVVIFGEFDRGKSTLINSLLGRYVLPAKLVPTTGHVTRVCHGSGEQVRVRMLDGQVSTCGLDQLDSFATLDRDGVARENVEAIDVMVDVPLLANGLVLMDTPGVNEQEAQTRRARNAILLADLVLLVLDARQLLGEQEQKLAVDWLTRELGKPVLLIVNFMNLVEEHERPGLRERLNRWCRTHLPLKSGRGWFEVNALGALAHALGKKPPPGDDFPWLVSYLTACQGDLGLPLRQGRRRLLLADIRQCRARNHQASQMLRQHLDRVAKQRLESRNLLLGLTARLEAEVPVETERLLTTAWTTLVDHLESLVTTCLRDRDRAKLQTDAVVWYRDYLSQAIQAVERSAGNTLQFLAGEHLRRPEQFTIRERMMLNARSLVPMIDPADSNMALRINVAETIGTFVLPLPLVGNAMGRTLMDWLSYLFSIKACSYAEACIEQARSRWQADSEHVLAILREQFDVRVAELRSELAEKRALAESPLAAATEEVQRANLERVLAEWERELSRLRK